MAQAMLQLFCCCPGPTVLCCKELLFGDVEDTIDLGKDPDHQYITSIHRNGQRCTPRSGYQHDIVWKPKVIFQDGRTYEGQWKGKLRHGQGKELSRFNDFVYEGSFKNDQYDGYGTMTWSNGAKYVGQFRANEKHGYGEEIYSTGERFCGYFENGRVHGRGQYFFQDQTTLKGDWEDGRLINELSTFAPGEVAVAS